METIIAPRIDQRIQSDLSEATGADLSTELTGLESQCHRNPEAERRPLIDSFVECQEGGYGVIVSAYDDATWDTVRAELDPEWQNLELIERRTFGDDQGEPWDVWDARLPMKNAA